MTRLFSLLWTRVSFEAKKYLNILISETAVQEVTYIFKCRVVELPNQQVVAVLNDEALKRWAFRGIILFFRCQVRDSNDPSTQYAVSVADSHDMHSPSSPKLC